MIVNDGNSSQTAPRSRVLHGERFLAAFEVGLILAFGGILTYNSLQLDGKYSPDSVFYINAAECLAKGDGFSRTSAGLFLLIDSARRLPLPVTQWAPLYSIFIAALSPIADPRKGALLVAGAMAVPMLLGFALLVSRCAGRGAGLVAVAILANFYPVEFVAMHAWSETLGMTLLACALACFLWHEDSARPVGWLIASGVFAGLAFAARYALLPLPFVCAAWLVYRRTARLSPAILIPWACIALPLIARRFYYATGNTLGSGRGTLTGGAGDAVRAMWRSIAESNFVVVWLGIALMLAAGAAAMYRRLRAEESNQTQVPYRWATFLIFWAACYLVFVVFAQWGMRVDPIDIRLALPATGALVVACVGASVQALRLRPGWALGSAIVLVAIAIVPQTSTARMILNVGALPPHDMERFVRNAPDLTWIRDHVLQDDLLIMEDGLDVPLFLGPLHVEFFSRAHDGDRTVSYEETDDYLRDTEAFERYGHVWFIVRPAQDVAYPRGVFIDDLLAGRFDSYPNVFPVATVENAVVFEWRSSNENAGV